MHFHQLVVLERFGSTAEGGVTARLHLCFKTHVNRDRALRAMLFKTKAPVVSSSASLIAASLTCFGVSGCVSLQALAPSCPAAALLPAQDTVPYSKCLR